MAIRRCPYCKAIIDESQKYCNNCGTQLLFPDDDPNEEPIKGERILDDDFPGDIEDQAKDDDDLDLDETAEREEIDLEKVLEGERGMPGEEDVPAFVDLREAEAADESPVTAEVVTSEEVSPPVVVIPAEPAKPEEIEGPGPLAPTPVHGRGRRKKSAPAEPPPPVEAASTEPIPIEEKIKAPEIAVEMDVPLEKTEDDVLTLTPPEPEIIRPSASDNHDEIARLIADFELRRRGLSVEDEPVLDPVGELAAPTEDELVAPAISEKLPPPEEYRIGPLGEEEAKDETEKTIPGEASLLLDDGADHLEPLAGDSMEFQDEVMKKTLSGAAAGPTMGIPETVTKLQEALPFAPFADEAEIEKELETIAPPDVTGARKVDFRIDDFALDQDLVRDDRDETEEEQDEVAEDAGEEEAPPGEREAIQPSIARTGSRLGIFRRVKAFLFDLLIVAVFWIAATGLAAGFLSVPVLDLVAAAAIPLALLFGAFLTAYLFLFYFFLGETPGVRLVTPKNSAD